MEKKPSVMLTTNGVKYWKLGRYLKVIRETNTAMKLEYYQDKGYLEKPEIASEIVRKRGAVVKRGAGSSTGRAKGGKPAVYVADARLKAIHIAKMKGLI